MMKELSALHKGMVLLIVAETSFQLLNLKTPINNLNLKEIQDIAKKEWSNANKPYTPLWEELEEIDSIVERTKMYNILENYYYDEISIEILRLSKLYEM